MIVNYKIHEVSEYINWIYFFHAWGFQPRFATIADIHGCDACRAGWLASFPEADRAKLDEAFGKSARELLSAGIEVGYSKEVKTGFKVGAKEGGYYISFSDADFDALLGEYLREKVSDMLFKA